MKLAFLVFAAILLGLVGYTEAYTECDGNICWDNSMYCCDGGTTCCGPQVKYNWYDSWWIWCLAVFILSATGSIIGCCTRRRYNRRMALARQARISRVTTIQVARPAQPVGPPSYAASVGVGNAYSPLPAAGGAPAPSAPSFPSVHPAQVTSTPDYKY